MVLVGRVKEPHSLSEGSVVPQGPQEESSLVEVRVLAWGLATKLKVAAKGSRPSLRRNNYANL